MQTRRQAEPQPGQQSAQVATACPGRAPAWAAWPADSKRSLHAFYISQDARVQGECHVLAHTTPPSLHISSTHYFANAVAACWMAEPGSCWFLSRTLGHNSGVQRKSQNRYADYKRVYVRAQLDKKLNFGFFQGGARPPPKQCWLAVRRAGHQQKGSASRLNIVERGGGRSTAEH